MNLGAFSMSLNVKDIQESLEFYQKLGFTKIGGDIEQNWLILNNGETTLGLFQGMFEKNTLTFVPGWDQKGNKTETFTDVRDIQQHLIDEGINVLSKVEPETTGPGSCFITDPDGNPILIDQHR